MSDFYSPPTYQVAKKGHRCTYCGEAIPVGEPYTRQTGVYDGSWYVSKLHDECFKDLCDSGDDEYTPYSNERPKKEQA